MIKTFIKKIKLLWNIFVSIWDCDEYVVITSKKKQILSGVDEIVYYEYYNNTNIKTFYIFVLDYVKKLYNDAKEI